MIRYSLHFSFLMLSPYLSSGQQPAGSLTLNAYFDSYFSAYTDDLPLNDFQQFTTVSSRDNQLGINAIQLGVRYEHTLVRAALTTQYGDIAKATWSPEFEYLQEGWAGIRLLEGLWLDAGFFTTHVGTESFLPKNNLLSSTTFATYIGPFYEAGARLSWEGSEKFTAALYVVNGYNQFLDRNRAKSGGLYFSWHLNEELTLTYSSLFGRESEEDAPRKQFLVYQNLYAAWERGPWKVIAGGDLAVQSNSSLENADDPAAMMNFLATARYSFTEKLAVTGRFELYQDPDGFLSGSFPTSDGPSGLKMSGYTLGMEYSPGPWSFLRAETRYVRNDPDLTIYTDNETPESERWEFMLTLGIFLEEIELFSQPEED